MPDASCEWPSSEMKASMTEICGQQNLIKKRLSSEMKPSMTEICGHQIPRISLTRESEGADAWTRAEHC